MSRGQLPADDANELPSCSPARVGLDTQRLEHLRSFLLENPSPMEWCDDYASFKADKLRRVLGPGADIEMVGPFTPQGEPELLVIRRGQVAFEHGNTTFVSELASATKSFLSTLAGVAVREGRIADVNESVFERTRLDLLASERNRRISWHHLLQQTSEWDGELFGKRWDGHDGRRVGQALQDPGTYFEYNDVRVNLLARCLLEVFAEPLPDVLRSRIMDPIGASSTWQWHGYTTSDVRVGGRAMRSVSGGAHWGGGLWACSRDLARYGLLYLNDGCWNGKRLLPEGWVGQSWISCPQNFMYGYGWWLQHDAAGNKVSFAAAGGGHHACFIVPRQELVVIVRWLADRAWVEFLNRCLMLATDEPPLGPVIIDFSRVNHG